MKSFRKILILFISSSFFTFLILIFFKPILTTTSLMFPYSVHPFDIVNNYPTFWFYIKVFYCCSLFFTMFLILNSLSIILKFKKDPKRKSLSKNSNLIDKSTLNLLVGIDSKSQKPIFIPEKGLYQNILITGTIGSRQNKFCIISVFRTTN